MNSLTTSNPRIAAPSLLAVCFGLILLTSGGNSRAANFGTRTVSGQVATWASIWTNPPDTTLTAPVAGNTYEAHFNGTAFGATATSGSTPNTRIRNPYGTGAVGGVQQFPGDSLTLNTNTEFRFKNVTGLSSIYFPGVSGNPGLILQGGVLNAGDDVVFSITGKVAVLTPSFIIPADNGAGVFKPLRGFNLYAELTGNAPLVIAQAATSIPQQVFSASNSFSGGWIVKAGALRGVGAESLGSGDITMDPNFPYAPPGGTILSNGPAQLELMYDINSAGTLTLINGGTMNLHQNCTFKAANIEGTLLSGGTHLYAELTNSYTNFTAGGSGSITILIPTNAPPIIISRVPTNNATFYPAASGLSFTAQTIDPNTIATADMHLSLNGADVTGSLTFSGNPTNQTASFNGLVANLLYTATARVTDQAGRSVTNTWKFDTFTTAGNVVIETENYNYDAGADTCSTPPTRIISGAGGAFIDNPTPGAYQDLLGLADIDYFVTSANKVTVYRCSVNTTNAVGTRVSQDYTRPEFAAQPAPEIDVFQMSANEWMNYTHTFNAGNYQVFLRVSATAAQQLRLDRVTSDTTTSNQTTATVGFFNVPNTGNSAAYCMIPLQDALGNNTLVNLAAGAQTLRLTALSANNNVQLNFMVLIPSLATLPPTVSSIVPANNAVNVLPDAVVQITLTDGDTTVNTNTISLKFDGSTVSAQIARSGNQVAIAYDPPGLLATNVTHTIRLVFADNATTF
ncbi:MAG TPA: hypothetical protein VGK40_08060, partial [Verrucomicrobiae bacterium]